MSLINSLNALRSDRSTHEDELTIPSRPVPLTFAHGREVRVALSANDCPILLLPASTIELRQKLPEADGLNIEFAQYKGKSSPSTYFLQITCVDPQLESVFLDLVENVCSRIQSGGESLRSILATIEEFRDLLRGSRQPIDRTKIIGLFGELLFLKKMAASNPDSVEYWMGPDNGRRDFLFPEAAIEVKTSEHSTGKLVVIHSLGQLDNDDAETLFLQYFRLEEDPTMGQTVGDLVAQISDYVHDKELFRKKLKSVGFEPSLSKFWNTVRWRVIESQPFRVTDGFPRIVSGSFLDGSPAGISHLSYQLDLIYAQPFEVSLDSVMEMLAP